VAKESGQHNAQRENSQRQFSLLGVFRNSVDRLGTISMDCHGIGIVRIGARIRSPGSSLS
jgi:hypothetical protein